MKKDSSKVVLYIAESLDGYIATNEESLEWLFKTEGEGDAGYSEFYETVDTVIMWKRTYDWITHKENENFPYKDKKCYVFSTTTTGTNEFVSLKMKISCNLQRKLKKAVRGTFGLLVVESSYSSL